LELIEGWGNGASANGASANGASANGTSVNDMRHWTPIHQAG
jgi:hypothetical protein